MNSGTILDTGPLVAYVDRREVYHAWAKSQFMSCRAPMRTCEAVLTESLFLLRRVSSGLDAVMGLLRHRIVVIAFRLDAELERVGELLRRYRNIPMTLADACLVRMSEHYTGSSVLTLDSDFKIYRKHDRHIIPTIMPPR